MICSDSDLESAAETYKIGPLFSFWIIWSWSSKVSTVAPRAQLITSKHAPVPVPHASSGLVSCLRNLDVPLTIFSRAWINNLAIPPPRATKLAFQLQLTPWQAESPVRIPRPMEWKKWWSAFQTRTMALNEMRFRRAQPRECSGSRVRWEFASIDNIFWSILY